MDSMITMTIDTTPKKGKKATQTLGAKWPNQSSAFKTSISSAEDLKKKPEGKETKQTKK